jgi:hypothetical protein
MYNQASEPGIVFISCAHQDQDRTEPLVRYLAGNGQSIWFDRQNIEPGTSYRSAIENALYEAACVLVVWTITSIGSDIVRSEAARGQQRGTLVPILLDAQATIPVGFTELEYVDLTRWEHGGGMKWSA